MAKPLEFSKIDRLKFGRAARKLDEKGGRELFQRIKNVEKQNLEHDTILESSWLSVVD